MPALVRACPSFQRAWDEHQAEYADTDGLVYVALGAFATHLVAQVRADNTGEFPAVFSTVERLFGDGDAGIRNAMKYGLIEGIGNVAFHVGSGFAARFKPWFGPRAALAWAELNNEWNPARSGDITGH